ncbi:interferon-induced, double-stranded RNA-activated protein kinase-like isoform X1 [Lutzomyia longipalpis]|uniref:interferon-induced, double-stranded RNA-activated protein kinase-like isoform X1 n=1 Tax=Lutzomyia longipalpis TaxID=7200 RepID=UPI0024840820|nr:interferon-induced, double-stranded RNA-activated protein kinase-like isoform X1 [Lutzomyia longipalpis]
MDSLWDLVGKKLKFLITIIIILITIIIITIVLYVFAIRSFRSSSYEKDFLEIEKLGNGTFGEVVKVRHKTDGQEYAIKKIKLTDTNWHCVNNEISVLARLDHRNVVRYNNSFGENGIIYIQMNIAQMTLRTWLDQRNQSHDYSEFVWKNITNGKHYNQKCASRDCLVCPNYLSRGKFEIKKESLGIGKQLVAAVQYIHNYCATVAQIADFGLASTADHEKQPFGSEPYAAPEKYHGFGGKSSDLFSVGIILLELLVPISMTTQRSFNGLIWINYNWMFSNLTTNYKKLIQRLMHHDSSKRPTAEKVLEILDFYIENNIDAGHSENAENQLYEKWPEVFKN